MPSRGQKNLISQQMKLKEALIKVKNASRKLVMVEENLIQAILNGLADELEESVDKIIEANKKDLAKIDPKEHVYDRIFLDEKRIKAMAASVREIALYDSPIGKILEHKVLENGLDLKKVSVPLGAVGAIFEARPNVLIDTFTLCFKSRNACVMKGGSEAEESNWALTEIILKVLESRAPELLDCVLLLANDRAITDEFLKMADYVDVIIPRGGQGLIDYVRQNSFIPVIETGRGVCHVFVDESADLQMAKDIVLNAKVSRPSVCNSMDTLLIHKTRLDDLVKICRPMEEKKVEIFAYGEAYKMLDGEYSMDLLRKADKEHFGMEFLSLKMSVKVVGDLDEAIEHINQYGSGHSEAIVTQNMENARKFLKAVDSADVFVNASTRFCDGGVYGLGAEIGISTQKLHARGPMGIKELTSYKWEILGNGQTRW